MLLIGLMSGTSADGIDAALVEIEGEGRGTRARLRHFVCLPHAPEMRAAILDACRPESRGPELCALGFALGERFAEAARAVAEAAGVPLEQVDAIASHGQTVWHQPAAVDAGGVRTTGTLQISEPAVIAERTGCTVVSGFRTRDMAAGGQGAPLVPYADWALLTSDDEARAVLNIGGIANVTHLPRGAELADVIAFDTGPGNMVVDWLARDLSDGRVEYDAEGASAARGQVMPNLLEAFLQHPYFAAPPPKTTGREQFGAEFAASLRQMKGCGPNAAADLLATATALTAESIARAFRDFLAPLHGSSVATVIVGGGGSHNATLMGMLRERLAPARLTTHAEFGIPDDAKEALAFALLGYETLHGRPSNIPSATGARHGVVLGNITPGR